MHVMVYEQGRMSKLYARSSCHLHENLQSLQIDKILLQHHTLPGTLVTVSAQSLH